MTTTKTLESTVRPTEDQVTAPAVLITGIGRLAALALAREGARVVVSGRRDDEGQKASAPCDLFVERSIQ